VTRAEESFQDGPHLIHNWRFGVIFKPSWAVPINLYDQLESIYDIYNLTGLQLGLRP